MAKNITRVVIVGAGFGGLAVANRLRKHKGTEILLIDRNNFHTFTPLLYQVATCALDPSEIAYPIRGIYRRRNNVRFLLGEVTGIDHENKEVHIKTPDDVRSEGYDYLVVAAGTVTNYFGNESLERYAFGLKSLHDTVIMRNHILKLFEKAAWTKDANERDALSTMVVVGGGPTGLETAGALYELYSHVLKREYNRTNSIRERVILIEATNTLLIPYPERLQDAALRQLEGLGVEVILGQRVDAVEPGKVFLSNGEVIHTHTLVWAAGVTGSPLAEQVGVELGRGRRIPVSPTMAVEGLENVFAIGDIAYLTDESGNPYPQVIPVAQQQGKLVAKNILNRIKGEAENEFKYRDRGIMATIGRRRAVAWPFYRIQLTGFLAWLTWLGLHLMWLLGFRNRIRVFINWVWNYFTYDRSVRIILDGVDKPVLPEPKVHGTPESPQSESEAA